MSNDDETVERVARAIYESDKGSGRLPWARLTELSRDIRRREARAALSAMPERELLREALNALTRIGALPRYTDGDNEAQDIARAALEHQQKGEGL